MATVTDIINAASRKLSEATETPRLDAEILLAHALGIPRSALLARMHEPGDAPDFDAYLKRRIAAEPIAYILGEWEFYSLPLEIAAPVLVPRPETEFLVEAVLDFVGDKPSEILEFGTGSGCVAVAILANAPACHVVATDIQPGNLALAKRNARHNNVEDRLHTLEGDLFAPIEASQNRFAVICSNPPYIETGAESDLPRCIRDYEDPVALYGGEDGLRIIADVIEQGRRYLTDGGLLALEIGLGQRQRVSAILEQYGYDEIRFKADLAGIDRIATARHTKA